MKLFLSLVWLTSQFSVNPITSYPFQNAIEWEDLADSLALLQRQSPVGFQDGIDLYLCRVNLSYGNYIPGKLSILKSSLMCTVPYRGEEFSSPNFTVLTSFPGTTSWMPWSRDWAIHKNMVISGKMDGETSYLCRATVGGDLIPGRLSSRRKSCLMAKDGHAYERTENIEALERNMFGQAMGTLLPSF